MNDKREMAKEKKKEKRNLCEQSHLPIYIRECDNNCHQYLTRQGAIHRALQLYKA